MRYLLIEAQSGEPAPRQMHAQFLDQLALAGDAIQIADQQNAQQKLGINRRAARIAVTLVQLFPYEAKADVLIDEPQQAAGESQELDLPGGSSRAALPNENVVSS
jgi:hypothetical protein